MTRGTLKKSKPPPPGGSTPLLHKLGRLLFSCYLGTALCYTTWHTLLSPATNIVLHGGSSADAVREPASPFLSTSSNSVDLEAKIERALQIAEDKGDKLWGSQGKKKGSSSRKGHMLAPSQVNARSHAAAISHYDLSGSSFPNAMMSWHPANDARAHPSSKLASSLAQNNGIHRKATVLPEDLFLSKAFGETLQPSSVMPYYYKATNNITKEDITITTLITANRLRVLVNLVENYQGPVSVCLHVTDNADTKAELLDSLHAIYTSNPSMMAWVDIHLVVDNFDRQFNMWRNVAKFFARTEYVMMLDVDFWICTDFRQRILSSPEIVSKLREGTAAFVVPAFEYNKQEDGMDVTKFPTEKAGLLNLVNEKKLDMFHKSWQPGHGATNYTRYYKSQPGEVYRVHSYTHSYEPYVVYKKEGTPYCDERFIGYGGNKAACLYELYLSGVSFFILPDDFLIHQSHPYAEKARKHERRYNRKLFTDFREELCFRYLSQFIETSQIDQPRGKNLLIECKKIKGFTNAAAKLIAAGT